jgi:hypothetical protein
MAAGLPIADDRVRRRGNLVEAAMRQGAKIRRQSGLTTSRARHRSAEHGEHR